MALLLWAAILIYLWRQPRVAALAWVQGVSSSGPLGTWQLRWRANSNGMQGLASASEMEEEAWTQVRLESYSYWRLGISLGFRCNGTSAGGRSEGRVKGRKVHKVQLLIPRGRISETQFRQLSAQLRHSPWALGSP